MELLQNHFWDWLILIGILAGAIYTLFIIGEEKTSFKDESYEVQFENLRLQIPQWWSITEQSNQTLRFERTDTRYDWFARFSYIPAATEAPLPELLERKLNEEAIEFDLDVSFETDSRVLFRDEDVQKLFQEVIRVEGKASQNTIDRIYYDIYLARRLGDPGFFVFESRSSVLNGLVEGPYFEESLSELLLQPMPQD